jgi:uncharacterized protein YeaO (DUF488 family)
MIKLKRVYDEPSINDGYRILVDRLWPRGLKKEQACIDLWLKDVAPSAELRAWFSHDPTKWEEFKKRYRKELKEKTEQIRQIKHLASEKHVITFVYAAHNKEHNNAVSLQEIILKN